MNSSDHEEISDALKLLAEWATREFEKIEINFRYLNERTAAIESYLKKQAEKPTEH